MFFTLYRWVWRALGPLIPLILKARVRAGKEDPSRLAERLGFASAPRPSGRLIWLHGASVGETQSLLALVDRALAQDPALHVLVTSGTVTSARLLTDRLPARARHHFIPVDAPDAVRRFLDHWRPDIAIFCESDLWPHLVLGMHARHIRSLLINAHWSARSRRLWTYVPAAARAILAPFSLIVAQTPEDADVFTALSGKTVKASDSLKYAADPLPVNAQDRQHLREIFGSRPLWLYASTHAFEETIAARIHLKLKDRFPTLLTLIAPRHPLRAQSIIDDIERTGDLRIARRSMNDPVFLDTDIYLIDTMGELGLFFSLAPITMMGRSLSEDGGGGHNPIEPAHFRSALLTGPHVHNLQPIFDDFFHAKACHVVPTEDALAARLTEWLDDPDLRQTYGENAFQLVTRKAHVMDALWRDLEPFLAPSALPASIPSLLSPEKPPLSFARTMGEMGERLSLPPDFWFVPDGRLGRMLDPVASLYQKASGVYRDLHFAHPSPVPVLCVGNLMVGGAGKTPLSLWLMERLRASDRIGFFLTRGYGGQLNGPLRIGPDFSPSDTGDEALLLARYAPTILARKRFEGACLAKHDGADFIIMDDGWQHPGIRKDAVIAVFDGARGLGNRRTLPAGPLREKLEDSIPQPFAAVIVGEDRHQLAADLPADLPVFRADRLIPPPADPAHPVIAFCGIGHPANFEDSLQRAGYNVVLFKGFPDHHVFDDDALSALRILALRTGARIVTTEKDHVRLPRVWRDGIDPIPLRLSIPDGDDLIERTERTLFGRAA